MMKRQFLLPDPGEGLTEAEIVAWRVTVGQEIEVNDVLVEIETAKSLVELPSPYAGTVTSLLVAEGVTVEVGTAIVEIEDGVERTDLETAEELREALGITRRGFQSDAVLGNVVRRTKPAASAQESDEASASDDAQLEESSDE